MRQSECSVVYFQLCWFSILLLIELRQMKQMVLSCFWSDSYIFVLENIYLPAFFCQICFTRDLQDMCFTSSWSVLILSVIWSLIFDGNIFALLIIFLFCNTFQFYIKDKKQRRPLAVNWLVLHEHTHCETVFNPIVPQK